LPFFLRGVVAHPSELPRGFVTYLAHAAAPRSFLLAARNAIGYDPRERWRRIEVPLRATFGSVDHLVPPKDMLALRHTVPHAVTMAIDDVGHFGLVERPDLVASFLFEDQPLP
jgi:pimeloyl-ACP methyl ester carboxylesterase